jgi:hypothetical protein
MTACAADYAIKFAHQESDLRFVERESRFGDTYIAIEDRVGVITVADNQEEADAIVRRALEKTS